MTNRLGLTRRAVATVGFAVCGFPHLAWAAGSNGAPATPARIFAYTGPDREQMLANGAKKEGELLWYTSEILDQRARPLANLFEKKYPFIRVRIVQLDSGPLMQRSVAEFHAGRYDVDIIEANLAVALALKSAGALAKFDSPEFSGLPPAVVDTNHFFAGDREIPLGFAYNTEVVPNSQAPKSPMDLLAPFWKGKLTTNDSVQAATYLGALSREEGGDYPRRLAAQGVTVFSNMSSNAVTNLVAAGTAVSTFPTSVGQVAVIRKKGAPIAWASLGKAVTILGVLELMSHSQHPHATALFADFLLSDEGQRALVRTQEGGTRLGLANDYGGYKFDKLYFDTSVPQKDYVSDIKAWTKMFDSIMLKSAR